MDCLYYAYVDALIYYGCKVYPFEHSAFAGLRRFAQGGLQNIRPADQHASYTWGGVAPWIIKSLAVQHGFYHLTTYTRIVTKEHYIADAPTERARMIAENTEMFTGDSFYDVPGIYLLLNHQHAMFSLKLPQNGVPVMSIVFQK
jgi:hypothetical protein